MGGNDSTINFKLVPVMVMVVACSVFSSVSRAADGDKAYHVLSINTVETCSDLNTAVEIAAEEDDWRLLYTFSLYTMGYLTAVNRLAFDTYDVAGGKNVKTHMVWLQRYCAENPKVDFSEALHQLVIKLYPRRLTYEPG